MTYAPSPSGESGVRGRWRRESSGGDDLPYAHLKSALGSAIGPRSPVPLQGGLAEGMNAAAGRSLGCCRPAGEGVGAPLFGWRRNHLVSFLINFVDF
jgi:hypothetical protein